MNQPLKHVEVRKSTDPRQTAYEQQMEHEAGAALSRHFPKWAWYVEVPPGQGVLVIKNLDLNPKMSWGVVRHTRNLDMATMEREMCKGARQYLERYESMRGHCGEFTPADVEPGLMHIRKPET